ncbi:autotransporter outer membrane beta-barrel domain-containing protein [Sphingopyxis terrae]|uniref:autotransporter outer membrane beta-barrel domain-containing protein n=1 Tax=Sphingopyxis terrae TaxID=33052 RepID=UPI000AA9FE11|nr:autotransporter outer membrane beta-barrel domain-containing protein [Sphingopyxis terrae]
MNRINSAALSPRRGKAAIRGRAALLLGGALVPLMMAASARAQDQTVVLEEGQAPVAVELGAGSDRVVVDISRVNADTGVLDLTGLTTGPLTDAGGRDTVWLRATSSQTQNVVFTEPKGDTSQQFVRADSATGTPFDGGTVYEASGNDTVLTLENRSRSPIPSDPSKLPDNAFMNLRHGPLQFAGDGTVVLTFSVAAADQPEETQQAIRVLSGSTSQDQGTGGDGKLSLIIEGDVGGGSTFKGLIDVTNAESLRLRKNSRVQILEGTAIVGGNADIFLEANTWVNSTNGAFPDVTLIKSSGRVYNSTKITVGGQFGNPTAGGVAVRLDGGKLYNILTEGSTGTGVASGGLGNIIGGSSGVLAANGDNYIENVGDISANTGAAVESLRGTMVLRNTVWNFSKGGTRAGTITGGMVDGRRIAIQGGDGTDMVVNSGTITGDVDLGNREDMFLFTGATNGVTGTIEGGEGLDGYGRSFAASATNTLSNDILGNGNSGFEMHGIEASGADTIVTVAAAQTLDAGLMLVGNGSVVNTAKINADGFGVYLRDIANVTRGMRFTNNADVVSTKGVYGRAGVTSFLNTALIRATDGDGVFFNVGELGSSVKTLEFRNEGTIETTSDYDHALGMQFDASNSDGPLANVVNTGTIRNSGARETFYDYEQFGVRLFDISYEDGNSLSFRNEGLVETTGRGVGGVSLDSAHNDVVNSGTIRADGMGGSGVLIVSRLDPEQPMLVSSLVNSGLISANGGAWTNSDDGTVRFNAAVVIGLNGDTAKGRVVNSGTIEAMGAGSSAVIVGGDGAAGATFELENDGTIRGHAETLFRADQGVPEAYRRLAGAIHTVGTTDSITNRNLIQGNVDLGDYDDQFRNYGKLDGDLRLGEGDDTYVFGGGSSLTGSAYGGDGNDIIAVDLTGDMAKRINASQFFGFEALTRLQGTAGSGKVSIFGNIDSESLQLANIAVHVDAGDTVSSASGNSGYTFTGTDQDEQIVNAGTIAGGVSMGGGNDSLENSGTIGWDVDMGAGDDVVTNSGRIEGNVNLGDGDDRYIASGGGIVTGDIDGGAGNNTFVFRLEGSEGEIPGSVLNFSSFGAYGPGTLTVNLDKGQTYTNLELLEGADLVLTGSNGSVENVIGDDSAQNVTIDGALTGGVSLGGGDDVLTLNLGGELSGALDGGDGTDTLNLKLTAASTVNDLFNFEVVNVAGSASLTLAGTLGAGQSINFDEADNLFIVDTGATFNGRADGGAGTDTIEINTGAESNRTIIAGQLVSFERLVTGGDGTLALNGESYSFESVDIAGSLSIGDGASLTSASGVNFSDGNNKLTLEGTGNVNSPVDGGDGTDTLAFKLAQGQTRNLSSIGNITGFEQLGAEGAGTLNIDQSTDSYRRLLLGDGATVSLASEDGGNASIAEGVTFSGDIGGNNGANTLTLKAGATVDGSVYMNGGNDVITNAGTIDGDLDLGDGDDRYIARGGGVVTGTIDGGAGNNTFVFNLDGGNGSIPGSVVNFDSFGAYGPGTLTVNLDAGQTYNNLELLENANLVLTGSNGSVRNVIGDDSAQSVTIEGALTGGVSLGGGDDTLTMQLSGLLEGALDGGAGTDTLNLNLTGASSIAGMYGFEITNVSGASPLTLTGDFGAGQQINFVGEDDNELIIGAGVKFEGAVNGGEGRDLLRVQSGNSDNRTVVASQIVSFEDLVSEGAGTLALTGGAYSFESVAINGGNLELGANSTLASAAGVLFDGANNRFTLGSGASVTGQVDGGAGIDTLALVQGAGTTRLLSALDQTGFEILEASGAGELRIDRDAAFEGGVRIEGGAVSILADYSLTADVTGGSANDILSVYGSVDGNVDLGAGNDTLVIGGPGNITGTRSGGEGVDRLVFDTQGTYTAPTVFDGTGFADFEELGVAGGVVSLTTDTSWDKVVVSGGRLIGQAGTTISSTEAIQVAHGATFGTAGIVNADINVAGTLSPGASPGTMTVNGNVAFLAGSNLLIEVSPTVSDLLRISGKLTIEQGAAIDITGMLQGTPGNMLDLVVAEGGITGRFTTINKSSDIFGFVVQNGNKLQIQSEFLNDEAFPTNVRASVDYANQVLRGGYGVQAFTAALPVLVSGQGVVNQEAFRQLTPEAYGSALQLGVENSLSLVEGAYAATAGRSGHSGLYSFGQFLTGSADVSATGGRTGASSSHLTRDGLFGGVGYGFGENAQVGVFFGGLKSDQTIGGLGAKTDMNVLAGGAFADMTLGGFGVRGLLAFNGGKAATHRRTAVAESEARAKYNLNSWVADLSLDYQVELGSWAIAPKLGVTYVHTSRGAAVEQGAGDFGLTIDKGSKDLWFGEAALAASGSLQAGGIGITPYAEIGLRQMLNDGSVLVSGQFSGADSGIVVNGIEREKTAVRVTLGLGLDLADSVRVQVGYAGEFAGSTRNSFMGGLAVHF